MQKIKLWSLTKYKVTLVNKSKLDYENRLEKWLIDDISILSNDLAVIGNQVLTSNGKFIDILAINSFGELIIIELKQDKTYREIIAQILDYATWVKNLDFDNLNSILNKYGDTECKDIDDYFSTIFDKISDDIDFNSDHKMLIVGSEIDDSTIRIIEYLSGEPSSVNINAVNFNYFKDNEGKEFLAQSFVRPESNILEESINKKRKRAKSIISILFSKNKLRLGQRVYLKPAIDHGINKEEVSAKIDNMNQNCLRIKGSVDLFSFSKLRKIFIEKYDIPGVRKNWGFGVKYDWIDEKGKSLFDLNKEN